jgi:hypothetical protein
LRDFGELYHQESQKGGQAEFNLELKDVSLEVRWAIEDVLDEMHDE